MYKKNILLFIIIGGLFVLFPLSLTCFVGIDFSEQYHIKGEARDTRCNEKSISSITYQ